MMNIAKIKRVLSLASIAVAFILVSGYSSEVSAQRDPFAKPGYEKRTDVRSGSTTTISTPGSNPGSKESSKPKGPEPVAPPPIEARIDYYKKLREEAAMNGQPIPKVTSVLLVNEMSVTGIFKTPRGYAAMVEAGPIKLSYTIYPGEKFFDGQLVAVEENRLIFRKVTKWSNNKFVSSVENKPLRQYSIRQEVQGTSPTTEPYDPPQDGRRTEAANNNTPNSNTNTPGVIVSPLDEMNNQPSEDEKDSAKGKTERGKKGKKRVSKNRKRP